MGRLDGKSVVITGSGAGIGAAYARLAASEGATVVICDIRAPLVDEVAGQIEAAGGKALRRVVDVTDWAQAEALIDFCVSETGKLDGLINNAGILHMSGPGEEDEQKLRRLIGVNVIGVAACGNFAIRQMRKQGYGSLINIVSGAHFGMKYMAAYSASKGAVASFTYTWTLENEDVPGIRVNAISPMARTTINQGSEDFLEKAGIVPATGFTMPEPESNAPVAVFLLSDVSAHLKGQIVRIDSTALSLVAHPVVLDPVLIEPSGWTVARVEEAFRTTLDAKLVPTGLRPLLKAEYVMPATDSAKPY